MAVTAAVTYIVVAVAVSIEVTLAEELSVSFNSGISTYLVAVAFPVAV